MTEQAPRFRDGLSRRANVTCLFVAALSYSPPSGGTSPAHPQVRQSADMNGLPNTRKGWLKILNAVRRVVRGSDNAEDLLHSAFVRLSEYSDRDTVENPSAFLVRTAANLAVDEGRRTRVRRESPIDIGEMLDISDGQPLHPEVLAARERLEKVMVALESLGPRTREIFLLHRLDGMKYREIAARLDITVSAVEKHIAKASLFLVNWVEGE
jgi:RNA polymerase sigma factor (sigma-70 family)